MTDRTGYTVTKDGQGTSVFYTVTRTADGLGVGAYANDADIDAAIARDRTALAAQPPATPTTDLGSFIVTWQSQSGDQDLFAVARQSDGVSLGVFASKDLAYILAHGVTPNAQSDAQPVTDEQAQPIRKMRRRGLDRRPVPSSEVVCEQPPTVCRNRGGDSGVGP